MMIYLKRASILLPFFLLFCFGSYSQVANTTKKEIKINTPSKLQELIEDNKSESSDHHDNRINVTNIEIVKIEEQCCGDTIKINSAKNKISFTEVKVSENIFQESNTIKEIPLEK